MSRVNIVVEVIEAVAQADGVDPTEVDFSLSDHIDPTVLEKLGDMDGGVWELTVRVSDHQVRLTHDRAIFVDGTKYEADTLIQE